MDIRVKDEKTINYFNKNIPEYSLERLKYAIKIINKHYQKNSSLIDIGCGAGNVLEFIKSKTKLQNLCGLDVSQRYLEKVRKRLNCDTLLGSVLDDSFMHKMGKKYDFVLLVAVLHHLIGKARKESKAYALLAIANASKLLNSGGYLIVVEPTFSPSLACDIIFYIKKIVTTLVRGRLNLFSSAYNIAMPVVSYYTNKQLIEMISRVKHCKVIDKKVEEKRVRFLWRWIFIRQRTTTTIVVRKEE